MDKEVCVSENIIIDTPLSHACIWNPKKSSNLCLLKCCFCNVAGGLLLLHTCRWLCAVFSNAHTAIITVYCSLLSSTSITCSVDGLDSLQIFFWLPYSCDGILYKQNSTSIQEVWSKVVIRVGLKSSSRRLRYEGFCWANETWYDE